MVEVPDLAVSGARLPLSYEAAKSAIKKCARVDECKDWGDKAAAIAAYARMADDDSLRKMCDRIQGRAVRRVGELLREYDGRGGDRHHPSEKANDHRLARREVAKEAGMSEHQQKTAVRVANIPEDEFEAAIESEDPPSVSALAEQGKKTRERVPPPLGWDAFGAATKVMSALDAVERCADEFSPEYVAGGVTDVEIEGTVVRIRSVVLWCELIWEILEERRDELQGHSEREDPAEAV